MKKIFLILLAVTAFSIQAIYPQLKNELSKKLDEYMTRVTELGYSGALLVAKEGKVVFSKGSRLANRSEETPVTPETIFTTGSVTKQLRTLQPDRDEIGAVEIGKIVEAEKNSFELTVRSQKTGQWWLLHVILEQASPYLSHRWHRYHGYRAPQPLQTELGVAV